MQYFKKSGSGALPSIIFCFNKNEILGFYALLCKNRLGMRIHTQSLAWFRTRLPQFAAGLMVMPCSVSCGKLGREQKYRVRNS